MMVSTALNRVALARSRCAIAHRSHSAAVMDFSGGPSRSGQSREIDFSPWARQWTALCLRCFFFGGFARKARRVGKRHVARLGVPCGLPVFPHCPPELRMLFLGD